ncbi:hypothetical protein C8R47DRAFT_1315944 [Mycena vitilis]|nr:hypothetical protein C8R47DRAFT_1315944 [Mycena vitilis]
MGFCRISGPSPSLETLTLRHFPPEPLLVGIPIDCPTIRSLAIGFSGQFYFWWRDLQPLGCFDSLISRFSFPNLENLKIVGGFTGSVEEHRSITVPDKGEAPVPTPAHATLGCFSRGITSLQLIHTAGNRCLLQHGGDLAWPALRSLTVETPNGLAKSNCLTSFLAIRASLGVPISELRVYPSLGSLALPVDSPPKPLWLCDAPSPALMDGTAGNGFYIDENDARRRHFEHVQPPEVLETWWYTELYERDRDADEWALDEIAEAFQMAGELVRAKGIWRELRREKRLDLKMVRRAAEHRSKIVRSSKRQRSEIREDFYLR